MEQTLAERPNYASKRKIGIDLVVVGGPAWIRTKDQGIHVTEAFPPRVDYLFTRGQLPNYPVGCGTL